MDHLYCVVERITYQNEENGYSVLKCRSKGYPGLIAVIGNMPSIAAGASLSLYGEWKNNTKYGEQFEVKYFKETKPASLAGIEKYLGSGLIKGVGPVTARAIIKLFKEDSLDIIEKFPERLLEVPGIGKKKKEVIVTGWERQKEIKDVMIFLQGNGISPAYATKIWKAYGKESIEKVKENPYRLADEIWGIGFKTADKIAGNMGIEKDNPLRLRSGFFYVLNSLSNEGHCFAERKELIKKAQDMLESDEDNLKNILDEMIKNEDLICEIKEREMIYLKFFWFAEKGCAKKLISLCERKRKEKIDWEDILNKTFSYSKIKFESVQKDAIRLAVKSNIMVLTGGPGTGKTTTLIGIIQAFERAGLEVLLCAPTGRAAKRMSEATFHEAKTIHRLLEAKPPEGYKRNEENPLKGDVLVVDEASMIDIILMYNLLKAIPYNMTLILVGDMDQLPSVGAGNVLKDIIDSEVIPTVKLKKIFRQAMGSRIITNAHKINKGYSIDMSNGKDSDFFFVKRDTPEEISETIVKFCKENLPKYYHVDPMKDIQVLTPMRRGECGANNLNLKLAEALNPESVFLKYGANEYRLHDKVMQIKNDYDKEVFNGDIGIISKINTEYKELTVDYDGREVVYDISEADELVPSYATTIHKSQGSEYPIVIIPISTSHFVMLQRNLLYTGVTRAKKILILIGQKKAVFIAIKNDKAVLRNTYLKERLIEKSIEITENQKAIEITGKSKTH